MEDSISHTFFPPRSSEAPNPYSPVRTCEDLVPSDVQMAVFKWPSTSGIIKTNRKVQNDDMA